ncbi:MAG TPA: adenine phosphoribosyltransferase [Gemmatimonadaceae bacterium]
MKATPIVAETLTSRLARAIRDVPDFPKPGILFKDITPALADARLLADISTAMATPWMGEGITHVAGIESRGFILAAPVALRLSAGFVPIRKPGKLPWNAAGRDYALEYGTDRLEMHVDACTPGSRVLLVDDVLATGGTAAAAAALIEDVGATVAGCSFLLSIGALRGAERLRGRMVRVLLET